MHAQTTSSATTLYADEWCSSPGVLDDTCFSNAITAILANNTTGSLGASRHMGIIIVRPGVYTFNHTVTIPSPTSTLGVNISIKGEYQTSVWGAVLRTGATPVDFFHVQADSVDIKNLAFVTVPQAQNIAAITLGVSGGQTTYDSHINWCWFAGMGQAIHIVNAGGLDLSHNTFDSGTVYGIFSQYPSDVHANYILATDLHGFGQVSSVLMIGDGTSNFGTSTFSGIFSHSTADAAISLKKVLNVNISGMFASNHDNDVNISSSTGVSLGPWQSNSTGKTTVHVDSSSGVKVFSGSIVDTGSVTGGQNTIEVIGSSQTTIHDVSSIGIAGAGYGLTVDPTSTGTIVYGNSFKAQTATAINIFDTSAVFPVSGVLTADHMGSTKQASIASINGSGAVCASSTTCTDNAGVVFVPNNTTSSGTVATINFGAPYTAGVCVIGNANSTYVNGGWAISAAGGSATVSAGSPATAGTYFTYICMGP